VLQPIKSTTTALLLRRIAKKEGYVIPKKIRRQVAEIVDGHPREALNILETICNYMDASSKKLDLVKAFPQILAQNDTYKAYVAAQDYVNGVLTGHFGGALKAVHGADNHTFFSTQIVLIMRSLIETIVDGSLMDRKNYWALSKVTKINQKVGRSYIHKYNAILKLFLEAQGKIKGYLLDPLAVLEATAIDAIRIIHAMKK
jgi:DNA polymerase III delta prime subunit